MHWSKPEKMPCLNKSMVHVWCGNLDVLFQTVADIQRVLSEDEHKRANRFRFEKDHNRFVVGRAVLRHLLGHYVGQNPKDLMFVYGPHGKPALNDVFKPITFNISHSHGMGLWAFGLGQPIGVDVEWVHRKADVKKLGKRFFSQREWADLCTLSNDALLAGFFQCWTQKEAFVKALGDGLSFSLKAFDVTVTGPAALHRLEGVENPDWVLHLLNPAPAFVGALATQGAVQVHCFQADGAHFGNRP